MFESDRRIRSLGSDNIVNINIIIYRLLLNKYFILIFNFSAYEHILIKMF